MKFPIFILAVYLTGSSLIAQEHIPTKKVDPSHIAEPVAEIVEHIVILAQNSDNKDAGSKKEVAIQATAGLLINAIKVVLAATHRGIKPDASQEEIATFIASLDQETIDEIQKTIVTRAQRLTQ